MRKRSIQSLLAFGMLAMATPGFAESKEPLMTPASEWKAALENDTCSLERSFTDGETTILLIIERKTPRAFYSVSLLSDRLSSRDRAPEIVFMPKGVTAEPKGHSKIRTKNWTGVNAILESTFFDVDPSVLQDPTLTLSNTFERAVEIQLTGFGRAMAVMNDCLDQIVASWGLDPTIQRNLMEPLTEPHSYDWMKAILRRTPNKRGSAKTFDIRLIIGADGVPSSCVLLGHDRNTNFEKYACERAMKRARFDPAIDEGGAPAASYTIITGFASSM